MSGHHDALETSLLSPGRAQPFTFEDATVLTVTRGTLWITVDGDGRDFVLPAGCQLLLAAGARIVVEALRETGEFRRHGSSQGPVSFRDRWQETA